MSKRMKALVFLLVLGAACLWGNGQKEASVAKELPPSPPFESAITPDDEGVVQPLDVVPDEPLKIAVLALEIDPLWITVKEGTMKAAEELKAHNCTVDWIVPPGDAHTANVFGSAIESAMIQNYDGIATIAGDSGIVPFINKAVSAGIPVATFNVETTTENKRLFFVGADLYKQGEAAGQIMAELINGEGKVAVITGFFSVEGHEARRLGFLDTLSKEAPNAVVVDQVESLDKADTAYNQTMDFITAHPDLKGLFVAAGGQYGAAAALEDAGMDKQVKLVCYDFIDETMAYVKKGVIAGTIGQDPYAQGHDPAIRLFNYLAAGDVPPAGRLLTRSDFVTKDNMKQFGF